jgi:hypothetical protein
MFRETWQMFCCVEFSSPCFKNTNTAWGLREKVVKNGNGKRRKVDVSAHVGISLPALLASLYLILVRDPNACDFCNVNFSDLLLSAKRNIPLYCLARVK